VSDNTVSVVIHKSNFEGVYFYPVSRIEVLNGVGFSLTASEV
jgi:hypothetical protein